MKKKNIDLTEGKLLNAILMLAIPVVINSFIQTMYNLTDTFWLGKLGTEELAAINLVTPVQNIVQNFGSGLTVAGAVLISQYIGAKRMKDARSMANQIFACAMMFAVVCASLVALFTPGIVSWLGADGETYYHAKAYLQLVIFDMPFLFAVNIFNSVHQAQGDTVTPMLLNLLGVTINIILDPLFMIALSLGATGAALATVVAKFVPAIIAFIALNNKNNEIHINLKKLKFEAEKLKNILVIGLPTALGGSTMQFGFLLMTKNVYAYGTTAVAAYGIGNKINGLVSLPSNGFGSAVSTIVGQNVGAGKYDRVKEGFKLSTIIITIYLVVGGFILSREPISEAVVKIFTNDPLVIRHATDYLMLLAFWVFANGVYNNAMGLFQGSGHTEVTMAVDASRLWIFRFATLFICQRILKMGVESIWYSVVISNGICAIIMYVFYLTGYYRKPRGINSSTKKEKARKLIEEEGKDNQNNGN